MSRYDVDIATETLMTAMTLAAIGSTVGAAGGTNTSAHNRTYMDGYYIQANLTANTSSAAGTANLQSSIDGTNFYDIASSTLSAAGTCVLSWNVATPFYNYVRVHFTITTFGFISTVSVRSVGD